MRWGLALCSCNGTLAFDPARIGGLLGLPAPPARFGTLPRDDLKAFADLVRRERFDRVAVACCGAPDLFRETVGAAGGDPARVLVVNLREPCFWTTAPGPGADEKAARLLRAGMRAAESARPAPELPVKAGGTVLIATDSAAGLGLARRLGQLATPVVILDERVAAFDGEFRHPLPWRTNWGRVIGVGGSLGNFRVTVERTQPLDLERCVHCRRCIPVCHTSAISEGLRLREELCDRCGDCLAACADIGAIRIPRRETQTIRADQVVVLTGAGAPAGPARTGYHGLRSPSPAEVDALAWKVAGLIGEFRKPRYVAYDPSVCAGGSAGHESCGVCIPACPYGAIARSPQNRLRVAVDGQACEGCGACVSACPTSALAFAEPPPEELYGRLRALLAPLPGGAPGRPVVLFHCPEEGEAALGEAGRLRLSLPAAVLPVPMACLRHVSEANILTAFRLGAAGVALVGCGTCPHGERALLEQKLALARGVLDAFGAGGGRLALITTEPGGGRQVAEALGTFAGTLGPPPVARDGAGVLPAANRDALAEAVLALIESTGREPGPIPVEPGQPYAVPEVRAAGCTLCRTCVNVCPTHAFRFDEAARTLQLKRLACVNCGLCATACPEHVIALAPALPLERAALDWQTVVRDEEVRCLRCGKPFGTRRALEAVEARIFSVASVVEALAGARRDLLRMCTDCRAVAAVMEMDKGWEP
jgi:ferredoxin